MARVEVFRLGSIVQCEVTRDNGEKFVLNMTDLKENSQVGEEMVLVMTGYEIPEE